VTAKVAKSHFGSQTESLKEKRRLMIATASLTCLERVSRISNILRLLVSLTTTGI
jgi:hypothetical protein